MKQTIETEFLTDQQIEDLFVGALEGGSNYWYYLPDLTMIDRIDNPSDDATSVHLVKCVLGSPYIKIPVTDINEKGHTKNKNAIGYISKENIEKGINLFVTQFPSHYGDVITGNDDASTADVFFQLVVLGKLVYG